MSASPELRGLPELPEGWRWLARLSGAAEVSLFLLDGAVDRPFQARRIKLPDNWTDETLQVALVDTAEWIFDKINKEIREADAIRAAIKRVERRLNIQIMCD